MAKVKVKKVERPHVEHESRGGHDVEGTKTGGHHHDVPLVTRYKANGNIKPMRFVSLHHHSTFSYKDGYQLPEAHVRRATELNMGALAMTEHGNTDSHVKFERAALEQGVKPIFGCEVYLGRTGDLAGQLKYHLTLLAMNEVGYRNLLAIVSKSWEDFYYEPTTSFQSIVEHKEGLAILSGCNGSLLFCSAVGGKAIDPKQASYKRAYRVAQRFKEAFGSNYFIEVQAFPELESTTRANPLLARIGKELDIQLVATADVHYTHLDEIEMQMILHNIRGGARKTMEEQARSWGYDVALAPPSNDATLVRKLVATGLTKKQAVQAVINTELIAKACNVELPKLPMVRYKDPQRRPALEVWNELLREGWTYRGHDKLSKADRKRYKAQIDRERYLIESKDFVDYFLIMAEGIRFIKDQGFAVGPGRGSAAASLIAYDLRITEIDPLRFPYLIFDRFIDETREDLPDIDTDLPSEARPILREYYKAKYGHVFNVGSFIDYKGKLALDDIARVYNIPKFEVNKVKDFLIERSSGDLRASSTVEDTVLQFDIPRDVFARFPELRKAALLEGNVKGRGVHAAGLVISNDDIREVTSVYTRELDGHPVSVVALDKKDAARQGLVKMDYLGLSTMSAIQLIIGEIGWSLDDLYGLDVLEPNKKVYDAFRANDVVGVFQFDGRAQRYVCGILKPDHFGEIMDCNALSRPGPLHNGAARAYAEIKHGGAVGEKFHPAIDVWIEPTNYQFVYQEQILNICRHVGNFPWSSVAKVREIIAQKYGEQQFNREWKAFRNGALTVHKRGDFPKMDEETALRCWKSMITAGAYSFNAAHCAVYGIISYWTMYFKQHYPEVFFSAALRSYNEDRQHDLIRDAARGFILENHSRRAVEIRPPHPSKSDVTWKTGKRSIRAGFQQIPGIGEKMAPELKKAKLKTWDNLIDVKGIGPKKMETMTPFLEDDDPFDIYGLERSIQSVSAEIEAGKLDGVPARTHTAKDIEASTGALKVTWMGTILNRNIRDIFEVNKSQGRELDPKKVKDPHLNEWAMLTCEDDTDQILLEIDRWRYPAMKKAIFGFRQGTDLLLVEATKSGRSSMRKIKVKRLWVITP